MSFPKNIPKGETMLRATLVEHFYAKRYYTGLEIESLMVFFLELD
jgi:hypothetical protein